MQKTLINRPQYVNKALLFRDTDLVKVVTGIRRSGKSSLLRLLRGRIEADCQRASQLHGAQSSRSLQQPHASQSSNCAFVSINLEDREFGIKDDNDLYAYCKQHRAVQGRTYYFIDEIQRVANWHDVINSLRVGFDCDIYLTGSNAFLLSSELATYLSGRYVEIKMLPLAFSEYLVFCGLQLSDDRAFLLTEHAEPVLMENTLTSYLENGGMPAIAKRNLTRAEHATYFESLYETVIVRDILNRERFASERKIQSPHLLRVLAEYLADSIGNMISAKKIADTLTSSGNKITNKTVTAYLKALNDAYIFYPAKRYDMHGKTLLHTLPKQYIVDLGLRSYLTGYRERDRGRVFENAVYLQLLFEGWTVHVGKLYDKEIDFVCSKEGRIVYVQVADEMLSAQTKERELRPLLSIKDNFEKWIVVRQGEYERDIEGIRIFQARDFFSCISR